LPDTSGAIEISVVSTVPEAVNAPVAAAAGRIKKYQYAPAAMANTTSTITIVLGPLFEFIGYTFRFLLVY
jgi:hypothetical protein